jgi:hypothetical protein
MTKERRQKIRQVADGVREFCESKGSLGRPIDVNVAIGRLGGEFEPVSPLDPDIDYEAKIERTADGGFRVMLALDKQWPNPGRERFSLAHELGHYFLHMNDKDENGEKLTEFADTVFLRRGRTEQENEAHEFAATFVMPETEYRVKVQENLHNGRVMLNPIADYFGVSVDAARNRGRWLKMFSWD